MRVVRYSSSWTPAPHWLPSRRGAVLLVQIANGQHGPSFYPFGLWCCVVDRIEWNIMTYSRLSLASKTSLGLTPTPLAVTGHPRRAVFTTKHNLSSGV